MMLVKGTPSPDIAARIIEDIVLGQFVESVRYACIQAWQEGHEEALMAGLCEVGAGEAGLCAIRKLDLSELIAGLD